MADVLGHDLDLNPVSDNQFTFERTDATLSFDLDDAGEPTGLVMRLGGVDYPAKRTNASE